MDFTGLTARLADIREKVVSVIGQINVVAGGEPFYARFFLVKNKHIIGLVDDLRVNGYKIIFNLTEEKLINKRVNQKISKKEVNFEEILRIEVFKTASGKPMFIEGEKTE